MTWKGLTPGAGQEGGAEALLRRTDSEKGPVSRLTHLAFQNVHEHSCILTTRLGVGCGLIGLCTGNEDAEAQAGQRACSRAGFQTQWGPERRGADSQGSPRGRVQKAMVNSCLSTPRGLAAGQVRERGRALWVPLTLHWNLGQGRGLFWKFSLCRVFLRPCCCLMLDLMNTL